MQELQDGVHSGMHMGTLQLSHKSHSMCGPGVDMKCRYNNEVRKRAVSNIYYGVDPLSNVIVRLVLMWLICHVF